jgi:hypothetical protein
MYARDYPEESVDFFAQKGAHFRWQVCHLARTASVRSTSRSLLVRGRCCLRIDERGQQADLAHWPRRYAHFSCSLLIAIRLSLRLLAPFILAGIGVVEDSMLQKTADTAYQLGMNPACSFILQFALLHPPACSLN